MLKTPTPGWLNKKRQVCCMLHLERLAVLVLGHVRGSAAMILPTGGAIGGCLVRFSYLHWLAAPSRLSDVVIQDESDE